MRTDGICEVDLVKQASDDVEAFGELVERYRGSIIRQCYSRVRDMDHAEDLAQEAFVRAYTKLGQLNEHSLFANWLRKIASNVCSEFLRSPARREWAWDEVSTTQPNAPAPHTSLDALSDDTRAMVELFYNSGLSYSEIAEVTGTTVAAVKGRLHRAKAVLREEMADMAPEEKSPFTTRVLERLEQIRSADPEQRRDGLRTLKFAMGEDKIEQIAKALIEEDEDPGFGWRSGAITASKRYVSTRLRDALIHVLLNDRMEENRLKAAGALVAQKDPEAIPYLRKAIDDPMNPKEVVAAAKSTIRYLELLDPSHPNQAEDLRLRADLETAFGNRKARVEVLHRFTAALGDPDAKVRKWALKAVAALGDKRAVPAVCKLLADPVQGIRHAAAKTLGDLGSERAVPHLAKALGPGCTFAPSIIKALGEIGSPKGVPAMLDAIERSGWNGTLIVMTTHALVRCVAVDQIESVRELVKKGKAEHSQFPIPSFLDGMWRSSLVKATDERYVPDLLSAITEAGDDGYVSLILDVIGGAGDADRRAANVGAVACRLQWRLIQTLRAIGGDKAFDALSICLTEHGIPDAGHALADYGERGLEVIRAALASPNSRVRWAACWVIRGIGGDAQAEATLREIAASDPDKYVRMPAKAALLKTRKPNAWGKVAAKRART